MMIVISVMVHGVMVTLMMMMVVVEMMNVLLLLIDDVSISPYATGPS